MPENEKVAPKFKTFLISKEIPTDPQLGELKYWADQFLKLGLAPDHGEGAFGNLSFRVKDGFIITCTRFGKNDVDSPQAYVKVISVDYKDQVVKAQGQREPSSESMLHYAIYEQRPDVKAVFHGHYDAILNDKSLVHTKTQEKYGTIELVNSVLDVLGQNNFIVMTGHGFIALGKNMDEAGKRALSVCRLPGFNV